MSHELTTREKKEVSNASAEQIIDANNSFLPDCDIYDIGSGVLLFVDMPGVHKGDVKLVIDENNVLSITGRSNIEVPGQALLEQSNLGNYYRAFALQSDLDKSKISAQLDNGVLRIEIPRKEEAQPRQIEISA